MISNFKLITGIDIPYKSARLIVHQPTLREISYLEDESSFFLGCDVLNFSKENLIEEEKEKTQNVSDFEIILSILKSSDAESQKSVLGALMLLEILFPAYQVQLGEEELIFIPNDNEEEKMTVNKDNYDEFKDILVSIFRLKSNKESDFNPAGDLATRIIEKIKKGKQKVAAQKMDRNVDKKVEVFSRYLTVLSVGECKNLKDLRELTVWQFYEELNRFILKYKEDINFSYQLAGAKDIKREDWMKDMHNDNDDD